MQTHAWALAIVGAVLGVGAPAGTAGEPRYYDAPMGELRFEEERPVVGAESWEHVLVRGARQPYAVLDGAGEVYLRRLESRNAWGPRWRTRAEMVTDLAVCARLPEGAPRTGTLFVPIGGADPDRGRGAPAYTRHRFELPEAEDVEEARRGWLEARAEHYTALADADRPGGAWFRHRAAEAREALAAAGGKDLPEPPSLDPAFGRPWNNELERSYDLFSGGRALSENLKLDTLLAVAGAGRRTVPVADIRGVETPAMDWDALAAGLAPEPDPLAALVPEDQHAVFFADFERFAAFVDEVEDTGLGVFGAARPRADRAPVRARYERQMGVPLDALARLLGPRVVRSVAMTGSDPFLSTGTDVALLFEAPEPELLVRALRARQDEAAAAAGTRRELDQVGVWTVSSVAVPDRSVSSHVATVGAAVVLTNSRAQLERLVAAEAGALPVLSESREYAFFRDRYPRASADETAFVVLTDATIRRWCGPRWRIAASRRVRARAHQADEQARWIASGRPAGAWSRRDVAADLPDLALERHGARSRSDTYGTLDFQTPILELELDRVTAAERDAYEAFRGRYQQSWRRFFDPIAASVSLGPETLAVDLSVIPLIAESEYGELVELCGDARLAPDAGDPHASALVHLALALDTDGPAFEQLGQLMTMFGSELEDPLAWVGGSFSLWVDDGALWDEVADDPEVLEDLDERLSDLPLCVRVDSRDPLRLAAFLSTVRSFVEGAAPGLVEWHPRERGEDRWVEIRSAGGMGDYSLHYAALPEAWLLSLNEDALLAALDRRRDPDLGAFWTGAAGDGAATPEWAGGSVGLRLGAGALPAVRALLGEEIGRAMRLASWSAIPALNEWRRLEPGADAVALHRALWGVEVVCPGGGEYVWDEEWQTYGSTVYGHPADPRGGPVWPAVLAEADGVEAGLTFEHGGLRARLVVARRR